MKKAGSAWQAGSLRAPGDFGEQLPLGWGEEGAGHGHELLQRRGAASRHRVGPAAAGVTPPPQVTHVDLWTRGPARVCWYPGVLTSE